MKKCILIISILFFGLILKTQAQKDLEFNTILIQFFPAFDELSQIDLDLKSNELIFYRFGSKEYLLPPSDPADSLVPGYNPNVEVVKRPLCSFYKLDDNESDFITDSILNKFSDTEMKDSIFEMHDGIFITMFITLNNDNKVIEIELSNALTDNHVSLFNYLLNLTIENHSDTLTKKYLIELKKYWD
jgi:hypothetical protein